MVSIEIYTLKELVRFERASGILQRDHCPSSCVSWWIVPWPLCWACWCCYLASLTGSWPLLKHELMWEPFFFSLFLNSVAAVSSILESFTVSIILMPLSTHSLSQESASLTQKNLNECINEVEKENWMERGVYL